MAGQGVRRTFATPRSLTQVDGIDIFESARLESEGITDIPSLAKTDLVSMMVNTRLPIERLVDWTDQAVLILLLDEAATRTSTAACSGSGGSASAPRPACWTRVTAPSVTSSATQPSGSSPRRSTGAATGPRALRPSPSTAAGPAVPAPMATRCSATRWPAPVLPSAASRRSRSPRPRTATPSGRASVTPPMRRRCRRSPPRSGGSRRCRDPAVVRVEAERDRAVPDDRVSNEPSRV